MSKIMDRYVLLCLTLTSNLPWKTTSCRKCGICCAEDPERSLSSASSFIVGRDTDVSKRNNKVEKSWLFFSSLVLSASCDVSFYIVSGIKVPSWLSTTWLSPPPWKLTVRLLFPSVSVTMWSGCADPQALLLERLSLSQHLNLDSHKTLMNTRQTPSLPVSPLNSIHYESCPPPPPSPRLLSPSRFSGSGNKLLKSQLWVKHFEEIKSIQ